MKLTSILGALGAFVLLSIPIGCGGSPGNDDPGDEGALQSDPSKPHYELVQQRLYQNYKSTADSSTTGYDTWDVILVKDTTSSQEYFVAQAFKTDSSKKRTPVFEIVILNDEKHTTVLRDPDGKILSSGLTPERAQGVLEDFETLQDFIESTPSCTSAWIQAGVASLLMLPATALAAGCFFYGGPAACVLAIQLPLAIAVWDDRAIETILKCGPEK
jgi:hypothetical protein